MLLVSHDRDFIDRVATTTIALEGNGNATVYPGGWSDYVAQRPSSSFEPSSSDNRNTSRAPDPRSAPATRAAGLTFTERKRFDSLPALIDRLEAEIGKLAEYLEAPELFTKEPVKFRKASEGMADRQAQLTAAEAEWLNLDERS